MNIAVVGCCHGELDAVYQEILAYQSRTGQNIHLVLMNGDFQAIRNHGDLKCMAVPAKFLTLGEFPKYYTGEKQAPILTLVIGGNHEASNHFQELFYGGWLAPNIYYMGVAGVLNFGGLRIAGLSGIYKHRDFNRGHFEHPPFSEDTKRSIYHVRNLEVFRLKQLKRPIDIVLSHDWPCGITDFGDCDDLLRRKPFFEEDISKNQLGNPHTLDLMRHIKPRYWFSAHMHCHFQAKVDHDDGSSTKFLAFDKCLPRRRYVDVIQIEPNEFNDPELCLDPEWLCILQKTDKLLELSDRTTFMPGPKAHGEFDYSVSDEEVATINEMFDDMLSVPTNFTRTAPTYIETKDRQIDFGNHIICNPQTTLLCEVLEVRDPNAVFLKEANHK